MDVFLGWNPTFRALRPNLRRAGKLLRDGRPATGQVTGIRVVRGTDDSPDRYDWAVAVGGQRLGLRQRPSRAWLEQARLGDQVELLVDDDGGAILAIAGEIDRAELDHKVLGDPPPDGITDGNVNLEKERRKAVPAQVAVRAAARSVVLGIPTQAVDLQVDVTPEGGAPYPTRLARRYVPFYALHLVAPGTVLPGLARPDKPDKVSIDWPAAAMAAPGTGTAAAISAPPPAETAGEAATTAPWVPAVAAELGEHGGITFEQWVAVSAGQVRDRVAPRDLDPYAAAEHGVAPGTWAAGEAAWQRAMMTDPRIGAAYGEAFAAAKKRR